MKMRVIPRQMSVRTRDGDGLDVLLAIDADAPAALGEIERVALGESLEAAVVGGDAPRSQDENRFRGLFHFGAPSVRKRAG